MKKVFFLQFIYIFIFLLYPLYAQVLPDYKERELAAIPDSLLPKMQSNIIMEATEGSVDPGEYKVGPGDKIFISISGIQDINLNLIVNQEGVLFIPKVGAVNLTNTLLLNAKEKISSAINKYYKNVDVFISLADFRRIKVSLLGDVRKPSSYVLPGNARLVDLVMNSNGLNETSNYRNIRIINRDADTVFCDLLSYLRFGKRSENPLLREGDIVLVDKIDKTVSIYGSVKYPGVYEFVEGETAESLIDLAGGFLFTARKDTIEFVRFTPDGREQVSRFYAYDDFAGKNIILQPYDNILTREIPDYYHEKFIKIEGFVNYPGFYKINENETTLKEIIESAGGFRKEASLIESKLIRTAQTEETDPELERLKLIPRAELTDDEYDYLKAKSRQLGGRVVVDFYSLFKEGDDSENLVLKAGDVITIPESKNYIILLGQVVNPGNIIYHPEYTVEDYINLAGGFGWRAQTGNVRIIKANSGEWVDVDDVEQLEPGDTIWIPEEPPAPKFWDVFTTSLTIVGQVASIIAATVAIIVASR